jgi:hypothetical protein
LTQWIENIAVPYRKSVIEVDPNIEDGAMMIIYIDCYPVHIGEAFRTYVCTGFPYIFLCFVPANCKLSSWSFCCTTDIINLFNACSGMGKAQPADVGLNRVIKHQLKQSQLQYLINVHQAQIASGLTPKQVEISTSLPVLRDATVAGLVEVYDFMTSFAGRQLVKKVCTDVFVIDTYY